MSIKLKSLIKETKYKQGECFRNASKWAWDNDNGKTIVVHGKVTNAEGRRFDHAWAEVNDAVVMDPTQGVMVPKDRWYALLKAEPEAKYTPHQAMINMARSRNYGPWYRHEVEDRFIWRKDD